MDKLNITFFSIILISVLNGFCSNKENSISTNSIIEVDGQEMPGWEKQIIERYSEEEGGALPVIFRGAAKSWEAAAWAPEYFAENFGDVEVQVFSSNILEDNSVIHTKMVDHIRDINLNSKKAAYFLGGIEHNATSQEIMDYSNEEKDDNAVFIYNHLDFQSQTQFPQLYSQSDMFDERFYFLLIGSANTITDLHSHGSTFLAQVYGSKLATLINPKYIEKCYCKLRENKFVFDCDIDILNPDFEKYPELENIEIYQTILEPGDVLYIPEGWLHDIRGLSTSISIASGF